MKLRVSVLAVMLAVGIGCGTSTVPVGPSPTLPTALCTLSEPPGFCRHPAEVEHWLHDPKLEIVAAQATPAGIQGAKVLTLVVKGAQHPVVFRAKWRAHATANRWGSPRRELAAYAVQRLFLQPHEYVAPPAAGYCFDIAQYRWHVERDAEPSFEKINCVYGVLSYWLEDMKSIRDANAEGWLGNLAGPLDKELFWTNITYRRSIADVNVLTILIRHGDSHSKQFLLDNDPDLPRVYSVDHTIAFESPKNPKLGPELDWSRIQVPALSRKTIGRLRRLRRERLSTLLVIEEYENRAGRLVHVPKSAPSPRRDAELRWMGDRLQIGLTISEIEGIEKRLNALLDAVDRDEIRLF